VNSSASQPYCYASTSLAIASRILTKQAMHSVSSIEHIYIDHLKWLIVHLITLIILLTQLAWEGAVIIYNNREEIRASIKSAWRTFEKAFIYESPIYN
jgi:hypothetical protein